jgi:MerR family transcriptional regulator, repressor of the yfmOP operon
MNSQHENKQLISIGDLAKSLNLTTRTLRYWEEASIIEAAPRSDSSNRYYTQDIVQRVRFIITLKEPFRSCRISIQHTEKQKELIG